MANRITILSISELLEQNFYIPSYQRGYRWSSKQVEELLSDIYAFALKTKKTNEFYCLQPVVVKAAKWQEAGREAAGWEVVDGQQRLTTIRILLSYLVDKHLRGSTLKEEFGKDLFSITYETRPESKDFLDHVESPGTELNIDFYHMAAAYTVIDQWFSSQPKKNDARQAILSTLTHDRSDQKSDGIVQVIWYEIEEKQNPISTFIRINLGKIPLTSAELIKALFLQERYYSSGQEIGSLRQLEIAREWDQIENDLQQPEFWWFLNKDKNEAPSRISLIFDLLCQIDCEDDPLLAGKVGSDKHSTFRYYNLRFEEVKDYAALQQQWQRVKDMYRSFEEWFQHPVWYHYVGFLIYCGTSIPALYKLTRQELTKEKITQSLSGLIAGQLENITWAKDSNGPYLDLNYPKNDAMIKRVLLLFNLVPVIKQSEAGKLIYKFPFQAFKEGHWDTEHIDAFNSRNMKKRKDQLEWLEFAMDDLQELLKGKALLDEITDFMHNANSRYNFDYLAQKLSQETGEDAESEENEAIKDNIGNLTLLNAHLNRSYGNALFPTKRRKIIEYDAVGDFMPMNTKNVFLKYYDPKGKSRTQWSREDMEKYRTVIAETLAEFLPQHQFKTVTDEQI